MDSNGGSAKVELAIRNLEFWESIVAATSASLEKKVSDLQASGLLGLDIEFKLKPSGDISPTVTMLSDSHVRVVFPEGFFLYFDEAVKFIVCAKRFRESLWIADNISPTFDFSRTIHRLWSEWVLLHEIGHVLCGHLKLVRATSWAEFDAASGLKGASPEKMFLRRAMEIDADQFAARSFLSMLGGLTITNDWSLFYGVGNPGKCLRDIAMMFVPLFLELDHLAGTPSEHDTHPPVFHRISCFMAAGNKGYLDRVGARGREHIGGFNGGISHGLREAAMQATQMVNRERSRSGVDRYRNVLIGAGLPSCRVLRMKDDWLVSGWHGEGE